MTTPPAEISVTVPFSQAIDRVKQVLFQPFDLGKWFIIGFCAWLAQLGEQGFSFNFPSGSSSRRGGGAGEGLEQARDFAMQNLWWIVPLILTLICVVIGLWLVFTWLSSRGKFMFLHCVALDRAEVSAPWSQFSRQGNSLFLFRIVLGLISFLVTLPFLVLAALAVFSMVRHEAATVFGVLMLIALVLGLILVAVGFFLVGKLTMDFVVPLMFLRGNSCLESWKEFLGLLRANPGHFLLYLLFQLVLAIAIGAILLAIIVVTCCLAGCLMAIPYIGTVLLLPVFVFSRSYSLHYFAQYGRQYDVFPPTAVSA